MATSTSNLQSTPMMRAMAAAVRANVPVLIWGQPGTTKTASIEAHAAEWGFHSEVVVGGCREAVDFMGLPVEIDGEVRYSKLAWFRRLEAAERGLLVLDEFTSIAPATMRAMVRIVQERWVGDHQLPDSVSIVAIANPPETAVDGWDLAPPVANRFFHLNWAFDRTGWLEGVLSDFAGFKAPSLDSMTVEQTSGRIVAARTRITEFLRSKPQLVAPTPPTDPAEAGKAWPSPRSWTNAMAILGALDPTDDDAARLVLMGCVGEGAAIEFMTWDQSHSLHDPEAVLNDPSIVEWSKERPDRLFALVNGVVAIVQMDLTADPRNTKVWEKGMAVLVACAEGGKPDAAMPAARRLLGDRPEGAKLTEKMRDAFAPILTRMGRLTASAAAA
jgi:MoxR-like ATPase